jgi:hypothetical protein
MTVHTSDVLPSPPSRVGTYALRRGVAKARKGRLRRSVRAASAGRCNGCNWCERCTPWCDAWRAVACSGATDCERPDSIRRKNAAEASQAQAVAHRKLHRRSRRGGPTSRRQRFSRSSNRRSRMNMRPIAPKDFALVHCMRPRVQARSRIACDHDGKATIRQFRFSSRRSHALANVQSRATV